MRDGIINKAWTLPDGNRPPGSKSGCSFFPLYYQAGNFIAGWRSIWGLILRRIGPPPGWGAGPIALPSGNGKIGLVGGGAPGNERAAGEHPAAASNAISTIVDTLGGVVAPQDALHLGVHQVHQPFVFAVKDAATPVALVSSVCSLVSSSRSLLNSWELNRFFTGSLAT
jgi:hypothetical protein